jgi:hypothetical protein
MDAVGVQAVNDLDGVVSYNPQTGERTVGGNLPLRIEVADHLTQTAIAWRRGTATDAELCEAVDAYVNVLDGPAAVEPPAAGVIAAHRPSRGFV